MTRRQVTVLKHELIFWGIVFLLGCALVGLCLGGMAVTDYFALGK